MSSRSLGERRDRVRRASYSEDSRAENRRDAYEALGYATARDRLFQMDLSRRAASGRLAEVFGREAVTMDMRARTSGFGRVASRVFEAMSLEQRDVLVAYSAGVNKAVSEMRMLPGRVHLFRLSARALASGRQRSRFARIVGEDVG